MQLFLCGGRSENAQKIELVTLFAEAVLRKEPKRVLYIPTAMPEMEYNGIKYTYGLLFDVMRKALSQYGIEQMDMWTELAGRKYEELRAYSGIMIGGGNTFYLMDQFKRTKFDALLDRYIKEDGAVYGCSAGAVVLGKDIGTAYFGADADVNRVGLKDLSALDKSFGYTISCHYRDSDDNGIFEYSKKNGFKVIALNENAGLHVTDEKITLVGEVEAYSFDSGKKKKLQFGEAVV